MSHVEEAREIVREIGGDDWQVLDSTRLMCPHGRVLEWDGECPDGCVSPLREAGMI